MSDGERPLTPRKRPAPAPIEVAGNDVAESDQSPAPVETPSQPPLSEFDSPADGQTMRSGLKKRRRDTETTGLTPEEEVLEKRRARREAALTPAKKKTREDNGDAVGNDQMITTTEENGHDGSKDDEMVDSENGAAIIEAKAQQTHDEEMQSEVTPGPPVSGATNGNHIVANGDVHKKTLPAIGSLRMPSQHTPGKLASRETTRLHPPRTDVGGPQHSEVQNSSVDSLIATAAATERMNHELQKQRNETEQSKPPLDGSSVLITAPPRNAYVRKALPTVHEVVSPKIAPTTAQASMVSSVSHEEAPGDSDGAGEPRRSRLAHMDIWFTVILLVHCYWQFNVYPVWPKVREISDASILFYKDLIGFKPEEFVKHTRMEKQVVVEEEEEEIVHEKLSTDELESLLSGVAGSIEQLRKSQSQIAVTFEQATGKADETSSQLDEFEKAIEQVETVLRNVLDDPSEENVKEARDHLKNRGTIDWLGESLVTERLLEEREDPFWVPPLEVVVENDSDCGGPPEVPANLITFDDLEQRKKELQELASVSITKLLSNPDVSPTAEEWAREQILSLLKEDLAALSGEDTTTTSVEDEDSPSAEGLTAKEVLGIIDDELEIDLADGTGMLDYASLYGGARVIRSGPRATSPSLVDTLPMLNRMMALANLRFYGYGPEAAMTPTTPPNALGQCWAFEDMSLSKKTRWSEAHRNDPSNGEFVTLTLGLARPIAVTEVVLEHPSRTSRQPMSAISEFRLLGYADAEATGTPIPLGSFTFKLGSQRASFPVQSNEFIQSLTLAVDDNHGFSYSCLYRFRVHGTEE